MTAARKNQVFRLFTTFLFLLCICFVFLRVSPAHAATILEEGVSGTCGWKYEEIDGVIVFTLYPTTGEEGILGDWVNDPTLLADASRQTEEGPRYYPGWRGNYHQSTARIVVEGRVKARTCQAMFSGFRQVVSADLSGLDVTGVQSMCAMFYNCLHLSSLDVSRWDVSSVTDMRRMFCGCTALVSLDVSRWDVSSVTNMRDMFRGCSSLTSLDVSRWDVSSATDMAGMFAHGTSLTSLNLGSWDMSAVEHFLDMFSDLPSLQSIRLGEKVCVADETSFGDTGSNIGTNWMGVNLAEGGTPENPKGEVLAFGEDLCAFQTSKDEQKTGVEEYVRVASYLIIVFDKTSDEAYGAMNSQRFDYEERKALTKNAYKRPGYTFSGWKDSYGNFYEDEQFLSNTYLGYRTPITFYAQWKEDVNIKLTYVMKDTEDGTVLFSTFEELADGKSVPEGFFAAPLKGHTFIKWTSDRNASWSSTNPLLKEDEIFRIAKKGDEIISATFVAHYRVCVYTVHFDANIPSHLPQHLLVALPSEITAKYDGNVQVPLDRIPDIGGDYRFIGWNTQPDGTGGTYMPGTIIDNIKKDITLYARWEKRYEVQLTYMVNDSAAGMVSRTTEKFLFDRDIPKGARAFPLEGYIFSKWLCIENPHWSYSRVTLTKKEVERAIKRHGKFPAKATFVAYFTLDTYTITFDANITQAEVFSSVPLRPLTAKHGETIAIPIDYCPVSSTHLFLGWNTRKKGNGGSYLPGSVLNDVRNHIVFYAQWEPRPKVRNTDVIAIKSA